MATPVKQEKGTRVRDEATYWFTGFITGVFLMMLLTLI